MVMNSSTRPSLVSSKTSHVRVVARIRPMSAEEQAQGCTSCVTVVHDENDSSSMRSPIKKKGPFAFLTPSKRNKEPAQFGNMQTPITKNTSQRGSTVYQSSPLNKRIPKTMVDLPLYGSASSLMTVSPSKNSQHKLFDYDAVLDENSTQQEVYMRSVGDTVSKNIFQGYNATILAYGQTGSGKTYTMSGSTGKDQEGILPRAVRDLFSAKGQYDGDVAIALSYLEIHKDEIRDLLNEESSVTNSPLKFRDHGNEGIVVDGLKSVHVTHEAHARKLLEFAGSRRTTASTKANLQSSRSHAICTFSVTIIPNEKTSEVISAKLVLVDLAGSERIKQTGVVGLAKKESININQDLFVLAKVMTALADQSKSKRTVHVPYRDSKLTRLLRDSLGGNCFTVMVACVSPTNMSLEESINTLRYAERTRAISNSFKQNVVLPAPSDQLRSENNLLLLKLSEMKERLCRAEEMRNDDTDWKRKYEKLLAAADGYGLDLEDTVRTKDQRDAIFRNTGPVDDIIHDDESLHIFLKHSLLDDDDGAEADGSIVKSLDQRLTDIDALDSEIAEKRAELEKLYQDLRTAQSAGTTKPTAVLSGKISKLLPGGNSFSSSEIELPMWDSKHAGNHIVQSVELEQVKAENRRMALRQAGITVLENRLKDQHEQIHYLESQLVSERNLRCEQMESTKVQIAKLSEESELYRIQLAVQMDEVMRLQSKLEKSVSREELAKAGQDLEDAKKENKILKEQLKTMTQQALIFPSAAVLTTNHDPDYSTNKDVIDGALEGGHCGTQLLRGANSSFDDSTIESEAGDSQASSHTAIRIHAAKMLFWANKAIERGKTDRAPKSECSSLASSTGNGSDFKPDLRALQATTATAKGLPITKAPMAGKPPRALPHPSESEVVLTGMDKVANDATTCQCQGSAFAGNAAHVDFYLPKLGMVCTCGKHDLDKKLDNDDPTNLENILRPWQVDFLKSIKIFKAEDLVKQYQTRGDGLAKQMRSWRKKQGLASVKTKSCGIALHIWNKTCKVIVKSVQAQRKSGVKVFQKPDILEISMADNQTLSTIGWVHPE